MWAPVSCPRPTFPQPPLPPNMRAVCFARLFFQGDDDSLNLMDSAEVADSKREFP